MYWRYIGDILEMYWRYDGAKVYIFLQFHSIFTEKKLIYPGSECFRWKRDTKEAFLLCFIWAF